MAAFPSSPSIYPFKPAHCPFASPSALAFSLLPRPSFPTQGKELVLNAHSDGVDQVGWDPTSLTRLASISASSVDSAIKLWDLRAGSSSAKMLTGSIPSKGENINVVWSPNGAAALLLPRKAGERRRAPLSLSVDVRLCRPFTPSPSQASTCLLETGRTRSR